jgi:frataxin
MNFLKTLNKLNILNFYFSTKITPERYTKEVETILNNIFEQIDEKEYEFVDTNLAAGVLAISFNKKKNYVINIQRPNLQVWLSSPISGPQRFEFDIDKNKWINIRNNKSILEILNDEFNTILKENKVDNNLVLK